MCKCKVHNRATLCLRGKADAREVKVDGQISELVVKSKLMTDRKRSSDPYQPYPLAGRKLYLARWLLLDQSLLVEKNNVPIVTHRSNGFAFGR